MANEFFVGLGAATPGLLGGLEGGLQRRQEQQAQLKPLTSFQQQVSNMLTQRILGSESGLTAPQNVGEFETLGKGIEQLTRFQSAQPRALPFESQQQLLRTRGEEARSTEKVKGEEQRKTREASATAAKQRAEYQATEQWKRLKAQLDAQNARSAARDAALKQVAAAKAAGRPLNRAGRTAVEQSKKDLNDKLLGLFRAQAMFENAGAEIPDILIDEVSQTLKQVNELETTFGPDPGAGVEPGLPPVPNPQTSLNVQVSPQKPAPAPNVSAPQTPPIPPSAANAETWLKSHGY